MKIKVKLGDIDCHDFLIGKISEIPNKIDKIKSENPGYDDFEIEEDNDYECRYLNLFCYREETELEKQKRLKDIEVQKKLEEIRAKTIEAQEKLLLKQLIDKYGTDVI